MDSWKQQVWLALKLFALMWVGHWIFAGHFYWTEGLIALAVVTPVYLIAGLYHLVWGDRDQRMKDAVKTAVLTTTMRFVVGIAYVVGFIYLALAGGERP